MERFKHDMYFVHQDEEGNDTSQGQWCNEIFVSDEHDKSSDNSNKYKEIMIRWNDRFAEPANVIPTWELLRKKDYNPHVYYNCLWREELYHKLKQLEENSYHHYTINEPFILMFLHSNSSTGILDITLSTCGR